MRVLLVTQYFAPEVGATQNRMIEFARAFVRAGHMVDVLTEVPNHPSGVIAPAYRRGWVHVEDGGEFKTMRVWVMTAPRKSFRVRIGFYLSFLVMAIVASTRLPRQYDVVLATSPPLPAAAAGAVISRFKRALFVMDVRDLWPRAAIALGELSEGPLYRFAEIVEAWLYRRAALIAATTREFCDSIRQRPGVAAPVIHVPNGTRTDLFVPDAEGAAAFRAAHNLHNQFVVMYAGLHGLAQGLETVLEAAAELRNEPDTSFLFVGEGPRKQDLMNMAATRGLNNVRFLPERPVEACAVALAAADALLVPLAPNPVFDMFVPSKLFDSMAAGRPVILSVPGEAREILHESGAGVFVQPGDPVALAAAIRELRCNPERRREMGVRGRRYVEDRYDRRVVSDRLVKEIESGVEARG